MDLEKKKLAVPFPISDRQDYIQGIGPKEVGIMGATLAVLIIYVIICYILIRSMPLAILSAIFILCMVFMVIKRDSINENLLDKIKILIRYKRIQKKYEFWNYDVFAVMEKYDDDDSK